MEIKIKKFMELQDVDFSTPCEISGANGQGKTTLLRAILYVLSGKDLDGTTFSENVYPFNTANASECFADVSIQHEGRTFRKETSAKEVRAAGETESKIVKSINTKYYIDGAIVDKGSFESEVEKYTTGKSFHLFANPQHFAGLKVDEKRQIFSDFFGFKVYASDVDVNTLRSAIKNIKQKETELVAQIKGYTEASKPEQVEDLREGLNSEISKLETEIKENSFSLQPDEIEKNNKINAEIEALKNSTFAEFVPVAKKEKLQPFEISSPDMQKRFLQRLLDKEIDLTQINYEILHAEKEKATYFGLKNAIENYNSEIAGAKCSVCPVCSLENCPQKKTEIRSLSDLQFEFSLLEEKNWDEILQNLRANRILQKTEKEQVKQAAIEEQQKFIQEIEAENSEKEKRNREIAAENLKIERENAEILNQNEKKYAEYLKHLAKFMADKSEKISVLQGQIIAPKQSDNSAKYQKIAELRTNLAENQTQLDDYNKKLGFFESSLQKSESLKIELSQLRIDLAKKEREEILYQDAELQYYTNLQQEINAVLPLGFSLKLFEKNKSNDNITLTFDLLFNENLYFSNGQKTVAFAQLCKLFQTKSGVNFPIFIDESAILDEKNMQLILSLQNIILIRKSEENLTIKSL